MRLVLLLLLAPPLAAQPSGILDVDQAPVCRLKPASTVRPTADNMVRAIYTSRSTDSYRCLGRNGVFVWVTRGDSASGPDAGYAFIQSLRNKDVVQNLPEVPLERLEQERAEWQATIAQWSSERNGKVALTTVSEEVRLMDGFGNRRLPVGTEVLVVGSGGNRNSQAEVVTAFGNGFVWTRALAMTPEADEVINGESRRQEAEAKLERDSVRAEIGKVGESRHPFRIYGWSRAPDSAGGVGYTIALMNFGERAVKYLNLWVVPYNGVGDRQRGRIRGQSEVELELTGPIAQNVDVEGFRTWDGQSRLFAPGERFSWGEVWYNSTITCAEIRRVRVEYMDGGTYTYVRELPAIFVDGFENDCPYTD